MSAYYAMTGTIRYYRNLPVLVEAQNERIMVQEAAPAEEPFNLRGWKEPPHVALANLRPDTDAVAAFTPRYGVLSWYQGQPGIVTARDVVRFRDALRQAWEGNKNVLAQMWVDLRARLRVEPTGLEIVVEDLWTLIRLMFLRDWVERRASLCAACSDEECPTPYFLAVRKGQKFCSDLCAVRINVRRFRERRVRPQTRKKNQDRRGGKHAKAKKA